MSIAVSWFDVEQTIAHYEFVGDWTWEDFQDAINEVDRMIASVRYRVDVIIDFSGSPDEPPHSVLAHLRKGALNAGKNWGGGVFVGVSPFLRVMLNTLMRVEPGLAHHYSIADSADDAYTLILQLRAAQPNSEAED